MAQQQRIIGDQAADHMQLAGDTARQRRILAPHPILSRGNISQSGCFDAGSAGSGRRGNSSGLGRHIGHQVPSPRRHQDGILTTRQRTSQEPALRQQERGGKANAGQLDRRSYSASEYSDEVPGRADSGRLDRYQPERPDSMVAAAVPADDDDGVHSRGPRVEGDEAPDVTDLDLQRLYRMEIARRGTCQDCRRYGKDHTIIRGLRSLVCSCCGQEYDCSNWEEVNQDPSHRLLREPLRSPPPTFPSVLQPTSGGLRAPPPLKDRGYARSALPGSSRDSRYATVAPSLILGSDQKRRIATPVEDDDSESRTSPVSPIAITRALPLSLGSMMRKSQPAEDDVELRQASDKEVYKASKDVNRVGYLRYRLENRGRANEVDPLPAVYAVQELSKATKGTSLIRTGEVKLSQGMFHVES